MHLKLTIKINGDTFTLWKKFYNTLLAYGWFAKAIIAIKGRAVFAISCPKFLFFCATNDFLTS
jgi:hypothetical protein